ncbi:putative mucolipin-3 [Apostichopus japonicus]|uniref:Putative mucolipin-3 n=1 Tax=Stichopus japonicus TaxID=307972 RepID=A0A2G8LCV2_STIJA|nr:putative mucolipin-3 [Apostichopus japonicus]WDP79907.1 transient receptor potential channel mucolipin 3-1 [Apostichopus japonicus]
MRTNRVTAQRSISEEFQGNSIQSNNSSNADEPLLSFHLPEDDEEEAVELRRELKFFFMNPIEKYKARKRRPFKFAIQVIKIFLVTIQLVLFGKYQYQLTTFVNNNKVAMEHIFLQNWDPAYDSFAYPSTKSLYALYTIDEFYSHLDNVVYQYANIESTGIGTYNFGVNEHTKQKEQQLTFQIQNNFSFDVEPSHNVSVRDIIREKHGNLSFDRLIDFRVNFTLKSILIKQGQYPSAVCLNFDVCVHYDYINHGGRLPVTLQFLDIMDKDCTQHIQASSEGKYDHSLLAILFFDIFVMIFCLISFILCLRSLLNGRHLRHKTIAFFKVYYDKDLSKWDRYEFLNLWYVNICVSDCLTISGTVCKIFLDYKKWAGSDYCSLLLGLATSLVWFGILRYLGFFNKYNVLLVTFKRSMPNVLRFSVCAGIIYIAYGFAGWIILGPYHGKFRTFTITMECMFSLINGDDMFPTFEEMPENKMVIFVFSKLYLYSFISLFIYVVLSLFISVIMDTYETVKDFQRSGHIEGGDLKRFIALCEDVPESDTLEGKPNGLVKVHERALKIQLF